MKLCELYNNLYDNVDGETSLKQSIINNFL